MRYLFFIILHLCICSHLYGFDLDTMSVKQVEKLIYNNQQINGEERRICLIRLISEHTKDPFRINVKTALGISYDSYIDFILRNENLVPHKLRLEKDLLLCNLYRCGIRLARSDQDKEKWLVPYLSLVSDMELNPDLSTRQKAVFSYVSSISTYPPRILTGIEALKSAIHYFEEFGNKEAVYTCLNELRLHYHYLGDHGMCIDIRKRMLAMVDELQMPRKDKIKSTLHMSIARYYALDHDYENALVYFQAEDRSSMQQYRLWSYNNSFDTIYHHYNKYFNRDTIKSDFELTASIYYAKAAEKKISRNYADQMRLRLMDSIDNLGYYAKNSRKTGLIKEQVHILYHDQISSYLLQGRIKEASLILTEYLGYFDKVNIINKRNGYPRLNHYVIDSLFQNKEEELLEFYDHIINVYIDLTEVFASEKKYDEIDSLWLDVERLSYKFSRMNSSLGELQRYSKLEKRIYESLEREVKEKNLQLKILGIALIIIALLVIIFSFRSLIIYARAQAYNRMLESKQIEAQEQRDHSDEDPHLKEIYRKILKVVVDEEKYREESLQVGELAKYIGTNRTYISLAINRYGDTNFNQWINKIRINRYIQDLADGANDHENSIFDYGFASKTTFYRAFKDIIGLSPTQYIEELKQDS